MGRCTVINVQSGKIVKFKIPSLGITDTQLAGLPFGRQIEYRKKIEAWKFDAIMGYVSQKRTSYTKAIREFVKLYNVKEYYCSFHASDDYFDDSFEFYWK